MSDGEKFYALNVKNPHLLYVNCVVGHGLIEAALLERQQVLGESVRAERLRSVLETEIALTMAVTLELVQWTDSEFHLNTNQY